MNFSKNLKYMLEINDIQVKELSAKTGISKNTIDNYLSGQKSLPNAENAVLLAQELGTTVEFLVTGKVSKSQINSLSMLSIIHSLEKLKQEDINLVEKLVKALSK